MGLSAFNRAREYQARERAKNEQAEREQVEQKKQADEQAANAFISLFPLNPENPDFVTNVLKAREMCTVLTAEQREIIGTEQFNQLDEATTIALEMNIKGTDEQEKPGESEAPQTEPKTETSETPAVTEEKPKKTRRSS